MMESIILLVGASGSGKTTIAETLCDKIGLSIVSSYTTRPKRYPEEQGHIFVTDKEFDALEKVVGFTNYNGYRYCAIESMIDHGDIYIIDPAGVEFFKHNYHGNKQPIFVKIEVSELDRYSRMIERGDKKEDAISRIENDRIDFAYVDYDLSIKNYNFDRCVAILSLLFRKGE
ncbi:AAA family ATPase [Bacteroides sp.]|uniref:AAA family ATPase n=1 Tax=Bacteroides sp. TaxID=29523 RepID=UPI00261DC6D7|nr:AAA family ATPase [Bacteroides sp.]MDD3040040.1 AAA family ATPase [Bacteroides sp.]